MKTIKSADLRKLVKFENSHTITADRTYRLVSENDIRRINKYMKIFRFFFPYRKEKRDCDDFALIGKAIQVIVCPGRAWGEIHANNLGQEERHAVNIFIDENKEIKYYEPQSGKIFQTEPSGIIETKF